MQNNFKSRAYLAGTLRQLWKLMIVMPSALGNATPLTAAKEHILKWKFDAKYTREQQYEKNKKNAFAMIYKHCALELKALLKGDDTSSSIKAAKDIIQLLHLIKGLCCKFDPTKKKTRDIVAANKVIMCVVQEIHM